MHEFQNYVNSILNDLILNVTSGTSSFFYAAKLIAGFGALISVYMVWKKSVTDNEKIDMNEIYRIGILFIGIMFYGYFINLINLPLNLISESIKSKALVNTTNAVDFFDSYQFTPDLNNQLATNEIQENELNDIINESSIELDQEIEEDEQSIVGMLFSAPNDILANLEIILMESLFNSIHFFGVIAMLILNVVRSFFLIVLTYFGIFVLAISVYPGLKNSFFQWLQKYINVYLWLPISYIIQGIISKLFTFFKPITLTSEIEDDFSMVIIGMVGLCSIIGFALVPTMSSWLINAATNAAASKLKQKGGSIASTAKKTGKKIASKGIL